MAQAIATCKCRECGKTFTKTTVKPSRQEAESWEMWAESAFDLCTECWMKQKGVDGVFADIRLGELGHLEKEAAIVFYGYTFPKKDAIRELGAEWTDDFPRKDEDDGEMRWVLWINEKTQRKALKAVKEMGVVVKETPPKGKIKIHNTIKAKKMEGIAENNAKLEKEIAKWGAEPEYPVPIADDAWWNGKVYGGKNATKYIYIDKTKVTLTDDEALEMKRVHEARGKWKDAVRRIEQKYRGIE